MIISEKEYSEADSCRLLGISERDLRKRLLGTMRNGERVYRGADLQKVGSLIAIEKFNRKMEDKKMDSRVLDVLTKWEYGKKYTLKEMFWNEVEQWDATDYKKWLYDAGALLTHIFTKAIVLPDDEIQQLGHLKKNLAELYSGDFPENFYKESNVYKYTKRSCSNCLFRPSCYLHIGKDWSVKWCDNGKAGCEKYRGPFINEKRGRGER